jgi:hypothetical protein
MESGPINRGATLARKSAPATGEPGAINGSDGFAAEA